MEWKLPFVGFPHIQKKGFAEQFISYGHKQQHSSEIISIASNISTSDGTKVGLLTIAGTFKDAGSSYLAINPWTGEEITQTESSCITNKYIDACLLKSDKCKE